jgi:two-component system nitrogen regulation response regulator NtrX
VEVFIGSSAAIHDVMRQVSRAAAEAMHVLISGEPGTGRETFARAIHQQGPTSGGPFVKVDCAPGSPHDLEQVLFATDGARNGAGEEHRALERVRRGSQLYASRGGTLFLQNIVELPARAQLRLARVLRDREVVVMDEGKQVELDHRVILAGDASIEVAIKDGRLLPDLHKRLCACKVDLPALRARKEDIPGLAAYFVKSCCIRANVPIKTLSDSAQSLLAALPWKGNAVELRALMEGLVVQVQGGTIGLNDVLGSVQLDGQAIVVPRGSLREARASFETAYIAAVVAQHHGRIPEAARTLGIQRSNLYRMMRRLRVPRPNGRMTS